MMTHYHLYCFTQEGCGPCDTVKEHVAKLPEDQRAEIDFVPLKATPKHQPYSAGSRTALAEEHNIEMTPTLLVVDETLMCSLDDDGDEYCDGIEISVERFVGAADIIEHLPATLASYTYAIAE